MFSRIRGYALVGLTASILSSSGCASLLKGPAHRTQRSTSVVSFLYPGKENPLAPTGIPVLRLPLRVGVAFVPAEGRASSGHYGYGTGLSELQRTGLLEKVAQQFRGREYIQSIEIIPSAYLRPGGGFANLDQLRALLGIDVIALVAYDQTQLTDENLRSLAYWTIVGAYVVRGNKNDTHTLIDTAVFDIQSRRLLFRAAGTSQIHENTTAFQRNDGLREDGVKGFEQATGDLIGNLALQLEQFRDRLKQNPGDVQIERRPGYTGSGDFGCGFAATLALLGLAGWFRRKR